MDLGQSFLTKTLIGNTDAEKVFTPWWITLHHYLVYFLVILGLIAVPMNCMMGAHGGCSYDLSSSRNYLLPYGICRYEKQLIYVENKYLSKFKHDTIGLNSTFTFLSEYPSYTAFKVSDKFKATLPLYEKAYNDKAPLNYNGCLVKPPPGLFGFHVYWACVNQLGAIALYFPYLVLTLALVLVLLERILTRYMWTGQRIEKFYNLLVKEVIASGDIDKVDTKENRQKCRQIHYDFKGSWFCCKAYITQTAVKLVICLSVLLWSLADQCNELRESFNTKRNCQVLDYAHSCDIPSNAMNMVIFDMVNFVLFVIFIVAAFNLSWHLRFKTMKGYPAKKNDDNIKHGLIKSKLIELYDNYRFWRSTKLSRMVDSYLQNLSGLSEDDKLLYEVYTLSPDMQMLLNLLTEKEGIWSAILILSLFDKSFKNEFKVRDSQITSHPNALSSRRRDVTIAWNEPKAAHFLGTNVPAEHLMYVIEIDPPVDKRDEDGVTMMPACTADGGCVFSPVRKESKIDMSGNPIVDHPRLESLSRQSSRSSVITNSSDKGMTIIDGGLPDETKKKFSTKISTANPHMSLRRKTAILLGRKRSAEKQRNFKTTMTGLRTDTEYVITMSFVLSGRKLGSESYRILCNDGARKSSMESSVSTDVTPKSSISVMSPNPSLPSTIPIQGLMKQVISRLDSLGNTHNEHILVAKSSEEVKVLLQAKSSDKMANLKRLVILEFMTNSCGLCTKVAPQVEEIAEYYGGKSSVTNTGERKQVIFVKADVEECMEISETFGIEVLPSFLVIEQVRQPSSEQGKFYFDGTIKSTHIGQVVSKLWEEIHDWMNSVIAAEADDPVAMPDLTPIEEKHR